MYAGKSHLLGRRRHHNTQFFCDRVIKKLNKGIICYTYTWIHDSKISNVFNLTLQPLTRDAKTIRFKNQH